MKNYLKATFALGLALTATLGGCAQDATENSNSTTGSKPHSEQHEFTMIIDVRTPEEFATGHLEGAVNYDVSVASFPGNIGALDPAGNYAVYCRSGSRAGSAVEFMKAEGIENVTNYGGLEEASDALGLDIVK